MYFKHFFWSTVPQNSSIPLISSSLVFGLTSLLTYSFNSCQRFSIGLRSGDSAGVFHQLIELSRNHSFVILAACLGSLSCMNLWLVGYTESMNGSKVLSSISINSSDFIIPSKMQIPVLPLALMPAQTCTFVGCFGLWWCK